MRLLLLPLAWIYGCIIRFRNFCYDRGWLKSFAFDFPIVLIGNLSTGGTGKTPHTDLLIQHLKSHKKITTLSRGYKRTYTGFGIATEKSLVEDIGDEPKMYKQKHPDIEVAVHADRVEGVYLILQDEPDTQLILMDDGFQHRRIKAGYNILLTTFDKPFYKDYLLPAGNLREHRSAVRRAQTVIVTKCPDTITEEQMTEMRTAIQRYKQLPVHFTRYTYLQPRPLFADQPMQSIPAQSAVTLLTGIAGNRQLKAYLNKQYSQIKAMAFADHHYFTPSDLQRIAAQTQDGIIITTEKDAMRLMEVREGIDVLQLAIFVQPVAVECKSNEQALLHDLETWLSTMQTAAV